MSKERHRNKMMYLSRWMFAILAWGLVVSVVVQTFWAGMAIFNNPIYWKNHIVFVHFFEMVPILMLIVAFAGRLPKKLCWQSAGLIGLIFIQYFTANLKIVGMLHPVIALGLFFMSWNVARQSGTWHLSTEQGGKEK
ncbi:MULTISPECIES: DUF6220 domain-containing protein [Geobacillus]|jgi:mercuric ion transport protein|uniref:Uncharacterized protein n=2 Tax=Geobacillus thermodenitrificans TaxID=33940 RepID=A4IJR5_GEOTN|nr:MULTISPECIES: DUF6220 domain-containing protein [Geobacillus]ABO65569.1 hypothetical protein GTNG_0185 [Geobacillus thermodenitrificans NG80-2]ARA97977.1 hypothetical protein GD3902_07910 [Geobacillus thermodenitrificans]ARP41228.1 hypothetical protein GTHT12_03286 [Geobacillus thermodenitrificans]ATO37331.1 hypothetical protein GTID1_08975 [Geobacillus thermodenitrificans]KQB94842.1 hypothetical protein GEPA3_0195 [Geobacillus sp. PA-3]